MRLGWCPHCRQFRVLHRVHDYALSGAGPYKWLCKFDITFFACVKRGDTAAANMMLEQRFPTDIYPQGKK